MEIRATASPEGKVLTPGRFGDAPGCFCATWSAARGMPFARLALEAVIGELAEAGA